MAKLKNEEWVARRREPNAERIAAALAVLDKPSQNVPGGDDQLPEGYRSVREQYARGRDSKA